MSQGIIILATDTPHRRYFIKRIAAAGIRIEKVIFETELIKPNFPVGPFFQKEESAFEQKNFFRPFDDSLAALNVHYVSNINNSEVAELIRSSNCLFGVVFGTRKIKQNIVSLFEDGLINVHRGITQAYRGLDTNLWAIYHNDFTNIGVTVHDVNDMLDMGHIVKQQHLMIPSETKIWQLRFYETVLAADLTIEVLQEYATEQIQFLPQPDIGRYYSFMPLVIKECLPAKLERYLSQQCSVH